jgi:poly(3-hydroxybutyrate) depolymerase
MNTRKIVIRAVLVVIGLPIVLVLLAFVFFYSVFYFPNWTSATIAFHGTADPICPYNGGASKLAGGTFPNVPRFMEEWSRRNQCRPNPIESAAAADVTRFQYPDCADDARDVLYRVKGEGHQWPGGKRVAAGWMVGRY